MHKPKAIIVIKPGETIAYPSVRAASEDIELSIDRIYRLIQTGEQSRDGFYFDYLLEDVC